VQTCMWTVDFSYYIAVEEKIDRVNKDRVEMTFPRM